MSAIVQAAIVFVVVATAVGYASLKLMPGAWRRAFAAKAANWSVQGGLSAATARRVEAKLSSGGACGSCDSCKACATPAVAQEEGSGVHRRIPIERAA